MYFNFCLIPSHLYTPLKKKHEADYINILQGEKNVRILGWKRNKNDTRDKISKMISKYVYKWLRGNVLSDFKAQ